MTAFSKANLSLRSAGRRLVVEQAKRDVRRAPTGLPDAFQFAMDYRRRGVEIKPMQVKSEIISFLEFVQARQPRSVVEIGTASGGTLFLLARAAAPDAAIVSIDLKDGSFGGDHSGASYLHSRAHASLLRSFAREQQTIHLIRGDSRAPQIVASAFEAVDGAADVLFIDGDHRSDGVRADFRNYGSMVSADGLVAFHDIVPGPATAVGGVPEFWAEIKDEFNYREFVEDWDQGGYGIGLLEL